MKYALILPDGAADEPVEELDGRTPLEEARTPHFDWISINGRQGRVVTVPEEFAPASDVATLSLLGYDPRVDYPGRAPLEAAAKGLTTQPGELLFRCNLVTLVEGCMVDFTAGHISQPEADRLIADLNRLLSDSGCHFHGGVSYRNLMVLSDAPDVNPSCTAPHDIPDERVFDHQPQGAGARRVIDLMEQAHELLAEHEVNQVRRDLGDNPATDIWLWGHGRSRPLESFQERFGLSATMIAGVDLIRGIATTISMDVLDVPGATGYLDTDYAGKGAAAVTALADYDLVVVHIEAPDEAGHLGDPTAKINALERIDEWIVGPLLEALRGFPAWRIMIAPDHPTPVERRIHTRTPPPFCLAGEAVRSVLRRRFCESAAAKSDLQVDPGYELMEYFLRR